MRYPKILLKWHGWLRMANPTQMTKNGWIIMEKPTTMAKMHGLQWKIRLDDVWVPPFQETPMCFSKTWDQDGVSCSV